MQLPHSAKTGEMHNKSYSDRQKQQLFFIIMHQQPAQNTLFSIAGSPVVLWFD